MHVNSSKANAFLLFSNVLACAILCAATVVLVQLVFSVLNARTKATVAAAAPPLRPADEIDAFAPLQTDRFVCFVQTKELAYKQLWLLFGDEFVVPPSSSADTLPEWLLQLRASANTLLGTRPVVLSLASPSSAASLPDQIAAAERNVDVAAALQSRTGALVFVSYGIGRLAQAVQGNYVDGDARLYQLEDEFEALVNFSQRLHANVVLLQRPNPLCNGVRIDPALALCPAAQQTYLNFPSVRSLQLHDTLYRQVLRLYVSLCTRNSPLFALVNSDAALCSGSLALARTLSDSSFAADCLSYGAKGQAQLARLVWECIQ